MSGAAAKNLFPSYQYSYLAGYGFGPTRPQSHYGSPLPCATFKSPTEEQAKWSTARPKQFYLGPTKPENLWLSDSVAGSLLVMRGGHTHDAQRHGYAVLDLGPLGGQCPVLQFQGVEHRVASAPKLVEPSPSEAALMVGQALSGCFEHASRIVATGPDWALDVLAAIPGAVVSTEFYGRRGHYDGTCEAWGRRWSTKDHNSVTPYQVAQRLSGPSSRAFVEEPGAVASLMTGTSRKYVCAEYVRDSRWNVHTKELGLITLYQDGGGCLYGEPVSRWPSADDAWLVELVGDGEPIEETP